MADSGDKTVSAISARSLVWDLDAVRRGPATDLRSSFDEEAIRWQIQSQQASQLEIRRLDGARAAEPDLDNRLSELCGLVGSAGEQASLCWTMEQDTQRARINSDQWDEVHGTLVVRAWAEGAVHFLLGAAHALGNVGLRVAMFNPTAAEEVSRLLGSTRLPPGSTSRGDWVSLRRASTVLTDATRKCGNPDLIQVSKALQRLTGEAAFGELETRRGMDFHRLRPQSVAHTARAGGSVERTGATTSAVIFAPQPDPQREATQIHDLVVAAMEPLRVTMQELRDCISQALQRESVEFPFVPVSIVKDGDRQ